MNSGFDEQRRDQEERMSRYWDSPSSGAVTEPKPPPLQSIWERESETPTGTWARPREEAEPEAPETSEPEASESESESESEPGGGGGFLDEPQAPDEGRGDVTLGIPDRPPVSGLAIAGVILGGILLIVVLLFVLVQMIPAAGGRAAPVDTTATTTAPDATQRLDTPFDFGDLRIRVSGMREIPGSASEQPEPGMRWVAVEIEIVNDGTGEQDIDMFSMFDVVVADGGEHSPTIIGSVPEYANGRLAPGDRLLGEAVFEVPADAEVLQLVITSADRAAETRVDLTSD